MCCSSPSPPDYSDLADASTEAAQIMAQLGYSQLAFAQQQYNDSLPLYQSLVNTQVAMQNESLQQGRDYYDYMTNTFRPVEEGLALEAQNFNTAAYQQQLAAQAAADAGLAFSTTQNANARAMASMGVNPNSGKFAATQNQSALGLAAQQANAMTSTRQQADQMGWAKQMDVAGLGRNLAGASTASYTAALNAGNSAAQNQAAPGLNYTTMATPGMNAVSSGLNTQVQGLSNVANMQTSTYNAGLNSGLDVGGLMMGTASLYEAV